MELVTNTYRVTQAFPKEEMFGLTSQVRRSAISIPSNIAVERGRLGRKEFIYFLGNARGLLMELETQIIIAKNRRYRDESEMDDLLESASEVGKILNGLLSSLKD
jgi:four helix bundle protein